MKLSPRPPFSVARLAFLGAVSKSVAVRSANPALPTPKGSSNCAAPNHGWLGLGSFICVAMLNRFERIPVSVEGKETIKASFL